MKAPQGLRGSLGIGVVCLGALAAGFLPVAAADAPGTDVPAGKVESLLLTPEAVGDIVGVTFNWEKGNKRPYKSDDLGEHSACAMLTGPDVETFGRDYTGYRFRADRDGAEDWEFTVQQRVATYADAATATQTFQKVFSKAALAKCNGVIATNSDNPDAQWRFRIQTVAPTSARWVEDQMSDQQPLGYSCSDNTGVARNVIYSVKVCQYGNGAPAAATMVERITSQVAGVRA